MEAQFNIENCPLCPECKLSLCYVPSGEKDTETMGGYSIEYFHCPDCDIDWEVIEGKRIYPA